MKTKVQNANINWSGNVRLSIYIDLEVYTYTRVERFRVGTFFVSMPLACIGSIPTRSGLL